MLIAASRVITPDRLLEPGWLEWDATGRIAAVGEGRPPAPADETLEGGTVAPGFVDVHANGGGGASFSTTEDAEIDRVLAAHLAHGTTTMVASLVTAAPDTLLAQVRALAPRVAAGDLAGIHLEGPWLSPRYKGAHDERLLRDPDPVEIAGLLDAAGGAIRMVTIAPELPGALDAIRLLTSRGVVVAVGHTACDYAGCVAAVDAGARGATHLFNAMTPLRHREPGAVGGLWFDERVIVEIIADGVHVQDDLAAFVLRSARGRAVLVTDAMAATGSPDGDYPLGDLPVTVLAGVARIAGTDTIAGSTLTLDRAVRRAVAHGVPMPDAVAAATLVPSRYLTLAHVGVLEPGRRADVVVLDEGLDVVRVARGGRWVASAVRHPRTDHAG